MRCLFSFVLPDRGSYRGLYFTQLSEDYPLRFLHRLREFVAASFNAATLLLKPSNNFSNKPKRSTSRPYRCNNKTTFAFINSLLFFDNLPCKHSIICNYWKRRVGGIRSTPCPSCKQYNTHFPLVKGVLTPFFKKCVKKWGVGLTF